MTKTNQKSCSCSCCYDDGNYEKDLSTLFLRLEERIKTVRTARIYSSKRFKKDHLFYQRVTIVFSIISTLLALFFIGVDSQQIVNVVGEPHFGDLNQWLLVVATYVTLITLYASIRNPGEKIGVFKSNYMELTELLHEVQLFNKNRSKNQKGDEEKCVCQGIYVQSEHEYKRLSKVYAALLTQTENHDDIDYSRSIIYLEERCCEESLNSRGNKIKEAYETIHKFEFIDSLKKVIFALSLPLLILFIFLVEYASNLKQVCIGSIVAPLVLVIFTYCITKIKCSKREKKYPKREEIKNDS